jgi:hypothetical protein
MVSSSQSHRRFGRMIMDFSLAVTKEKIISGRIWIVHGIYNSHSNKHYYLRLLAEVYRDIC